MLMHTLSIYCSISELNLSKRLNSCRKIDQMIGVEYYHALREGAIHICSHLPVEANISIRNLLNIPLRAKDGAFDSTNDVNMKPGQVE